MAWIRCGLNQPWKSSRVRGIYNILLNLWLGSVVVWIHHESRQGVIDSRNTILHCGLAKTWNFVKGKRKLLQFQNQSILHIYLLNNLLIERYSYWTCAICGIVKCSKAECSIGSMFSWQIGQLTWWEKCNVQEVRWSVCKLGNWLYGKSVMFNLIFVQ